MLLSDPVVMGQQIGSLLDAVSDTRRLERSVPRNDEVCMAPVRRGFAGQQPVIGFSRLPPGINLERIALLHDMERTAVLHKVPLPVSTTSPCVSVFDFLHR